MSVITATDADFSQQVASHDKVVVKFYADWCGSCKLIAPKYNTMAIKPEYEGVTFLNVNAEENPEVRKAVGVNNLPFFATFKAGVLVKGDFTSKPEFVEKMIQEIL